MTDHLTSHRQHEAEARLAKAKADFTLAAGAALRNEPGAAERASLALKAVNRALADLRALREQEGQA